MYVGKSKEKGGESSAASPGAYQKKSEDSMGVKAMIDLLIADLNKDLTEAETTEKDA